MIHDDERREVHQFDRDNQDDSIASFDLDDDGARQLAEIGSGEGRDSIRCFVYPGKMLDVSK